MKKRLPPWCKLVKHTLIDKDMDVSELATKNRAGKTIFILNY